MTVLKDGTHRYSMEDKPWLSFDESTGDYMKVLHVDKGMRQVVFVQRFGKNTTHPKHTHFGTAIAYTISGEWQYDGEPFPQGTLAYEPQRSVHTPMTRDDNVADVLVILTADNEDGIVLESYLDGGQIFHFTLDLLAAMQDMKDQAEFDAVLEKMAQEMEG